MSAWSSFFDALKSPGTKETGLGQLGEGVAKYSSLKTQATMFDIQGSAAGMNAELIESQLGQIGVKREEIELDTVNAKIYAHQKWLARRGAVKAGFAARGIKVDASAAGTTPALIMAQMLSNIDEEVRQIELNKKLRIYNEVTIPSLQIQSAAANKRYERDVARINERLARRAAYASLISSAVNTISQTYRGYSAPKNKQAEVIYT